jgi:hypothetical protein|tara:strand:- start:140 stop:391 length:252 start_codon:yes stop_codon:yes gene_type:complete
MPDYQLTLSVLSRVFLEIRATSKTEKTRILSDIFNNVPALMASGAPEEVIRQEINRKALRHDASKVIDGYFVHARKTIGQSTD